MFVETVINYKHSLHENNAFNSRIERTSFVYLDYLVVDELVIIGDYYSRLIKFYKINLNNLKDVIITKEVLSEECYNMLDKIRKREELEEYMGRKKFFTYGEYDKYEEYLIEFYNTMSYYKTNAYEKEDSYGIKRNRKKD